jgi:hypothetical protein
MVGREGAVFDRQVAAVREDAAAGRAADAAGAVGASAVATLCRIVSDRTPQQGDFALIAEDGAAEAGATAAAAAAGKARSSPGAGAAEQRAA